MEKLTTENMDKHFDRIRRLLVKGHTLREYYEIDENIQPINAKTRNWTSFPIYNKTFEDLGIYNYIYIPRDDGSQSDLFELASRLSMIITDPYGGNSELFDYMIKFNEHKFTKRTLLNLGRGMGIDDENREFKRIKDDYQKALDRIQKLIMIEVKHTLQPSWKN